MGYNLTNERIQDTYEQLVQISGSTLLDGTGNVIPAIDNISVVSASYAITASYALNGGGGGATWPVSGTPSGLVSSSAQTLANADGGTITTLTASSLHFKSGAPFNRVGKITSEGLVTPTIDGFDITNSNIANLTGLGDVVIDTVSTFGRVRADNTESPSGLALSSDASNTGNIVISDTLIETNQPLNVQGAITASNGLITGDLVVNGTASFAYLQSITGSAKVIGDAFIILNADTPTQRYAGVKVYDSGSSPISTGSFQWDSVNNDWFYEYEKDATDYAVALFGPEFATKGTPTYPTSNVIQKGTGGHHLTGSIMTDDGTIVTVSGSVEVTGQIYSPTFAGSVASSTSSIDFDNGNFATLSLTAGTFLSDPSNLKSGTTYTIIISSGSLISGHGTAWKFAGGTAPTYTNGTDVLTCVSDGTNLYATALTDFQ